MRLALNLATAVVAQDIFPKYTSIDFERRSSKLICTVSFTQSLAFYHTETCKWVRLLAIFFQSSDV